MGAISETVRADQNQESPRSTSKVMSVPPQALAGRGHVVMIVVVPTLAYGHQSKHEIIPTGIGGG